MIAGMWPAQPNDPQSGVRILIQERIGGPHLAEGFSDEHGEFRAQLPAELAGKTVRVVIVEPSFDIEDYSAVQVNRWGLFLPIKQRKEPIFTPSKDTKVARTIDYERWDSWNATAEHAAASQVTHSAARKAEVAWPLGFVSMVLSLAIGIACLYIHPLLGLAVGLAGAWGSHRLSQYVITKEY